MKSIIAEHPKAALHGRMVLPWGGALLAVLLVLALRDPAASQAVEADTAALLSGFAGLKTALTLGALTLVSWRLLRPVDRRYLLGYTLAVTAMAGATAMVWQLSHLGAASLFFHGGLFTLLFMGWRDVDPLSGLGRSRRP
ncbi:hypothetical protein [Ectothiorhodospira lacustris]|uniref:hypothetical protein n=1 Tax=Ectothiorhodospira lacustris TaxID=2899127 RepID=UPI001EE7B368|nr:hypothetical protein [Ectothiorhodospira lacustris]MCG5501858.1 hypothetical protein [Ectothiorhodospira lacustris]MCG5511207.1 hypothetical protein [Ectothiorhodospira lacustris]MCG5522977.1 hypothetical protein [Ectothiorhodospira lacustris]